MSAVPRRLRTPWQRKVFRAKITRAGLEAIVKTFLSRHEIHVDRASFGVAGPVVNRATENTNLPWVIQESALADTLGLPSACMLAARQDKPAISH